MKIARLGLILSLVVLGAGFASKRPVVYEPSDDSATPAPTTIEGIPDERHAIFNPLRYHTAEDIKAVEKAEVLVNAAINSKCLYDFLLSRPLVQTYGKTPKEVIGHIRSTYGLTTPVEMYAKWYSTTIGYTSPPELTIYTNRKFHARTNSCDRASNLGHEWLHILGYTHDYAATRQRQYSVNYSFNAAMEKCCKCKSILDCRMEL